jgi:hypothetical protein
MGTAFSLIPQIVRKAHNLRMQTFEYVLTTFAAKNSPVFRFSTNTKVNI